MDTLRPRTDRSTPGVAVDATDATLAISGRNAATGHALGR